MLHLSQCSITEYYFALQKAAGLDVLQSSLLLTD